MFPALRIDGTAGDTGVTILLRDSNNDILWATATAIPSDAVSGYAKGCLFIDTDVATGTTGLYVNEGTNTSCSFKAITNA